ncbi:MAG: 4a-hydroxytetrahydrobiopterin dehydratase [Chloroflexi bacterium]|nr:4a-hydroxytetrahydrobiopterin dehydratase [Chloroflexota bacterium]
MTTADLAQRRCVPCRSGTPPLTPEEIAGLTPQVPHWTVEEHRRLRRTYRLKDFATALALVDQIGAVAEAEDHHPDLSLAWGKVEVLLWTHKIGGLSENDFILAAKIDALAASAPGLKPEAATSSMVSSTARG